MPEKGDWKNYVPVEHGFICGGCGLSDFGRERLISFGFFETARPCKKCADHFTPVLGPPRPPQEEPDALEDRPDDPVEETPLLRPVPAPTDTPGTPEAGTLW